MRIHRCLLKKHYRHAPTCFSQIGLLSLSLSLSLPDGFYFLPIKTFLLVRNNKQYHVPLDLNDTNICVTL
jgi:hypothetical protein